MSWIHMQMSKTCTMLTPFFHVSKMQYLFLKDISSWKYWCVFKIWNLLISSNFETLHIGKCIFNEFNSHLAPRCLIDNFPNYILLNIWVSETLWMKNTPFHHDGSLPQSISKICTSTQCEWDLFVFSNCHPSPRSRNFLSGGVVLFIFLISKFWMNVNHKIANFLEFPLE
jgi:hypothetical protein